MTALKDHGAEPATLPELEHLLLRTARRRAAPRLGRRRWVLALAAGSLILAAGAAAAATDVFHIADGQTSKGTYSIDRRQATSEHAGEERPGSICLQLRYNERGPAFGCGERPTAAKPFGLVIADSLDATQKEVAQRVIYGLVSNEITRVSVLGEGDDHTDTTTSEKPGLPGRFFSVVVPGYDRIELVGYDRTGRERARIGSRAEPDHPPLSHAEAVAQGDPAGFAPAVAAPTSFSYRGKSITPGEAVSGGLTCLQDSKGIRCYDSLAELDAAEASGDR